MVKEAEPASGDGRGKDAFFIFEGQGRLKVVAHYPRQRQVMMRRDKVGKAIDGLAAGTEPPCLHRRRMTAFRLESQAHDGLEFDGVALAAIQGLNQKLEDAVKAKEVRIARLELRLAELERVVRTLGQKGSEE